MPQIRHSNSFECLISFCTHLFVLPKREPSRLGDAWLTCENERRPLMKTVFAALLLAVCSVARGAGPERTSPGIIRFVVRTDPSWDKYTSSPSPEMKEWFRTKIWRMMVYSPYWDNKTGWYPYGWVYFNLYSISLNSPLVRTHPDWVLKDGEGNMLYIPYACKGGSCPQYAADITNPEYRAYWIDQNKKLLARGYKGIWIDDVNLDFRVSDGNGKETPPVNPKTHQKMAYQDWKNAVATFTSQIRDAFPNTELLHNAIWFAGGHERDADPAIKKELGSADYINLERGVIDHGLTGGNGEWSLTTFFSFIDRLHSMGSGVILDNGGERPEYSMACFFLISSGMDALGIGGFKPDHWYTSLDVDLGNPLGAREQWHGLIRRKYSRGVAIINPPGSAPVTMRLTGKFQRPDKSDAGSSITLKGAEGVVLIGPGDGKSIDSAIQTPTD
jgi:hypothetical protein